MKTYVGRSRDVVGTLSDVEGCGLVLASGLALGPVSDQSPRNLNLFIGGGLLSRGLDFVELFVPLGL